MEVTKRRSRFKPVDSGEPYRVTSRVLDVLQLLQRYRYLPTRYIHAFLGGDYRSLQLTLTKLRHDARFLDAHWAGHNALSQDAVYSLTRAGERVLKEHGLFTTHQKTGSEFKHELGVCLAQASFELGIKTHGLDLITARDILNHKACPAATRHLKEPWGLPVTFDYTVKGAKKTVDSVVESDGDFFGMRRGNRSLIIPGFEFDRRTEPLEPEDYDRPSIKRKFLAYRQLARDDAYTKRFGFSNYLILIITINEDHKESLKRVLETVTNGKGSKLFAFKAMPNFAAFDAFPPPTGHMLEEDWEMVGHPNLNILKELKGGNK